MTEITQDARQLASSPAGQLAAERMASNQFEQSLKTITTKI